MESKSDRLEKLREITLSCQACPLHESRPHMVFGEGGIDASVMFVGEGPGAEEQKAGRPFVGRSGKLLRDMIRAVGIPDDHHYIANVVKDRPPNNRPPEPDEIVVCSKFLIEIIQPKLLVLLGKTAVKGICPDREKESIEKLRSLKGLLHYEGIPVVVTYHPSALLRTPWRKIAAREDFLFIQQIYQQDIP